MAEAEEKPAYQRVSLHDLTLQRHESQAKPLQPLGRLCLVGGPHPSIGSWHEKAVRTVTKAADPKDQNAQLTGLLLVVQTGWIHLVEGSTPSLSAYLSLLRAEEQTGGAVRTVKVASCMDDVPRRTFSRWVNSKIDVARNNYMEVDDSTLPKLIADTVIGFIQLGKAVGASAVDQASRKLSDWRNSSFSDHMPSNERVQQLLDLEELPSLAEFIQTFDDVTDVTLGSDAVWPAEPPLIF